MSFALLTPLQQKIQVFDDVCSELAMAILQFFQVSNIALQALFKSSGRRTPFQIYINDERMNTILNLY